MAKGNIWMSVSDLMTGLMVIFLFVAIAYISRVNKNADVLTEYIDARRNLHDKLVSEFEADTARWEMTIGSDLSLRFTNPTVLFQTGSWQLTPEFCKILDEFLPKYFDILLEDSLSKSISEIRIEGHTDPVPYPSLSPDPYIANVILSQRRSLSVLQYFRTMSSFQNYTPEQQKKLEYWFTANGLSYGRTLDSNDGLTYESHNPIDNEKSRRVEFRIITTSEDMIEDFVNKINYR